MMQSPAQRHIGPAPSLLVGSGTSTDGALSATRFLSSSRHQALGLPNNRAPETVGKIWLFLQIVAPWTDNQIHDEHLMPADEQSSSRREKLASSGRCTTVTI
jgi:hypothetical protein